MKLKWFLNRPKRHLEKQYNEEVSRKQLNFVCLTKVIDALRALARELEVPVYIAGEHVLETGMLEVLEQAEDWALRDQLRRHLVERHLLGQVTIAQREPVSYRLLKLRNALDLLDLLELKKTPEEQRDIIDELYRKAGV